MANQKAQWTDLKNILLILVVIIVMVIIIKNYVYAPVANAAQCKSMGGQCMPDKCESGYYMVSSGTCTEGQVCCQAENPGQEIA
ncbi:MAG: hypothetical protein Q7R76_02070 [Candidatus Woesearchaeota archaeon]|nr:hypothetical protein [Candidatus Woesearchaeota archaeon]